MQSDSDIHSQRTEPETVQFKSLIDRLNQKLQRDSLVQDTTDHLRQFLQVDRVVLYYFYNEWEGRVTFEALSEHKWSIFGSTGPDQCFNDEYAALYLEGRVRAIENIETELIAPCHRDFLRQLQVRANLVVPILTQHRLWGLLVAHHCQDQRTWTAPEIAQMKTAAQVLATAPSINH
jgi:GAF domain-containing protein